MNKAAIFLVLVLALAGCSNKASNKSISNEALNKEIMTATDSAVPSITDKESVKTQSKASAGDFKDSILSSTDNYVGIYCYDYENDMPGFIEDNYIDLAVHNYDKYLKSLDKNNYSSISLAVNKYKTIMLDTKSINDALYRLFYDFY